VISLAGQPERQPNLKKPTALRGAVGVWDCENSDRNENEDFYTSFLDCDSFL
jgi:hypothetical protein